MVMTGGWFIIVLPTLICFMHSCHSLDERSQHLEAFEGGYSRQTPSICFASCRNIHFQPRRNDKHGQTMFEGFLPKFLMIKIEHTHIYIYTHIIPGFPVRFQGLIDCYSHSIIRLWVDTCKEFPAAAYDSCP